MKRAILVALLSAVVVAGCAKNKKTEAQAPVVPADPVFVAPQSTPAPAPIYTPAPEPAPAVTVAPQPQPAAQPVKKTTAAKPVAETKSTAKTASTSSKVYVVKKGDTLSEIAQAHHTTVKKILAANSGMQADKILVGQKIKLP